MLRHPSRRYIHYLFSKRTMDVPTIVQHLADLRLPSPSKERDLDVFVEDMLNERRRMSFPPGYDPLRMPVATRAFLKKWKIFDIWESSSFVRQAGDLLFEPNICRMVQTLALGPLSFSDIALRVKDRYGLSDLAMNTRVVSSFVHYYWNDDSMDTDDWRTVLFDWMPGYNNDMLSALSAPRNPAGAALTIAAADRGGGASPNPVSMYSAIRDQGFQLFMEHALSGAPSLSRTQGALFALQIITTAEEELDKRRGGSAELIEELNKIETLYDTTRLATVADLPQLRTLEAEGVEILPASTEKEGKDE